MARDEVYTNSFIQSDSYPCHVNLMNRSFLEQVRPLKYKMKFDRYSDPGKMLSFDSREMVPFEEEIELKVEKTSIDICQKISSSSQEEVELPKLNPVKRRLKKSK